MKKTTVVKTERMMRGWSWKMNSRIDESSSKLELAPQWQSWNRRYLPSDKKKGYMKGRQRGYGS